MFDKKKDLGTAVMPPKEMLQAIAEEMVEAFHARDTAGVTEALQSFLAVVQHLDELQDEQDQA